MNNKDWERLTEPDYVGGVVRETTEGGTMKLSRIARVTMGPDSIQFRFDRVAELKNGAWEDLPLQDNDFLWFPWSMMPIAFDADGTACVGGPGLPSFTDAIHPRTALPPETPAFMKPVLS